MEWKEKVMSFLSSQNITIYGISSAVGVGLDFMYGENHAQVMMLLIILIVMDWLSGIACSIKHQTYQSQWGIQGILRTVMILMFPSAAAMLDSMIGTPGFIFYAMTTGLMYHTLNSIIANIARAGWEKWIPSQILKMLATEIEAKNKRYERQSKEKKENSENIN